MWTVNELKECTRYGKLMIYVKTKSNGERICRRVTRAGDSLIITRENMVYKLPDQYADGRMLLTPGDLVFISQDYTASVLRNEENKLFASVTNGKLSVNKDFFK